jgi:hypothetical protein
MGYCPGERNQGSFACVLYDRLRVRGLPDRGYRDLETMLEPMDVFSHAHDVSSYQSASEQETSVVAISLP